MTRKSKSKQPARAKNNESTTSTPITRRVPVTDIQVAEKEFRDLDEKTVADLAESIEQVGLMHLPTVCIKKPTDESDSEEYHLVAGRHRLAAAKKLGWNEIDVIVVRRKKVQNRMRQITENLHRFALTKLEEAELIAEWIELHPKQGGQGAQPHDKGVSHAAKKLGKSKKSVRRALKSSSLHEDAKAALKRAGLDDNQKVILEVAEVDLDEQEEKVEEIVERRSAKKKSKKPSASKEKADELPWSATPLERVKFEWDRALDFRSAWSNTPDNDRRKFIDEVMMADSDDDDVWGEAA